MEGSPNGQRAELLTPLTLAFIGDAVYELRVRERIVTAGGGSPKELQKKSSAYAKAAGQAAAMDRIEPVLSEAEENIFKRGRNAHPHTSAKNAAVGDYRRATGFEALVGYLYMSGQKERLEEILEMAFAGVEEGR